MVFPNATGETPMTERPRLTFYAFLAVPDETFDVTLGAYGEWVGDDGLPRH